MSFLRHGEIYPCDEGAISRPRPRSSPWMSLQLAIPGRLLSSRARFRFTTGAILPIINLARQCFGSERQMLLNRLSQSRGPVQSGVDRVDNVFGSS